MIKRFSTYLVRRYLNQYDKRDNVSRTVVPFGEVTRIGVVYRAGVEADEKNMKLMVKEFESSGKKVLTLGFVDEKEVGTEYNPNIYHDFFSRKDLSRLKLPRRTRIMRFVTEPFDYLIYASTEVSVPLLGVTALSRARCRVGPYFDDLAFGFDLLIKNKDADNDYAEQIVTYIRKFNNG